MTTHDDDDVDSELLATLLDAVPPAAPSRPAASVLPPRSPHVAESRDSVVPPTVNA